MPRDRKGKEESATGADSSSDDSDSPGATATDDGSGMVDVHRVMRPRTKFRKKGAFGRWTDVWLQLDGNTLKAFNAASARRPTKTIPLSGSARVVDGSSLVNVPHTLMLRAGRSSSSASTRAYYAAEDEETFQLWLRDLRRVVAQTGVTTGVDVDCFDDATVITDASGTILAVNRQMVELLGYHGTEDLVGESNKILMPPAVAKIHDRYTERFDRTGDKRLIGRPRVMNVQHNDGHAFPALVTLGELGTGSERRYVAQFRNAAGSGVTLPTAPSSAAAATGGTTLTKSAPARSSSTMGSASAPPERRMPSSRSSPSVAAAAAAAGAGAAAAAAASAPGQDTAEPGPTISADPELAAGLLLDLEAMRAKTEQLASHERTCQANTAGLHAKLARLEVQRDRAIRTTAELDAEVQRLRMQRRAMRRALEVVIATDAAGSDGSPSQRLISLDAEPADADAALLSSLKALVERQIEEAMESSSAGTLFRGDDDRTRKLGAFMLVVGADYLQKVLGAEVARIHARADALRPDRLRTGTDEAASQRAARHFVREARRLVNAITASADRFPPMMRSLLAFIVAEITTNFPGSAANASAIAGGFLFLRFFVPAIAAPSCLGLIDHPDDDNDDETEDSSASSAGSGSNGSATATAAAAPAEEDPQAHLAARKAQRESEVRIWATLARIVQCAANGSIFPTKENPAAAAVINRYLGKAQPGVTRFVEAVTSAETAKK